MGRFTAGAAFIISTLVIDVLAAPQFITFKEGKLGVNFGGYHAAVGMGGLLGGGAGGGLFAEAGTPFGQSARAGLGGAVTNDGGSSGGLYAGATAGGNVKAETGLAGGLTAEGKSAGSGFAMAQAGDKVASSGLGGEASSSGASGFTFSGTKSFSKTKGVVKEIEVVPLELKPAKKVHKEFEIDAYNEVQPLAPKVVQEVHTDVDFKSSAPAPVLVKEVYVQPAVVEKHRVHQKPRHHFRKTAYIGGYVGGDAGSYAAAPPTPVVYKRVHAPVIQKRIDVGAESSAGAGVEESHGGAGQVAYTKQVTVHRNPQFFADIFNIPIQTLKAVGSFLGNAAGSTSVSVQKTASLQADADTISPKHGSSLASSASSDTTVSIQTPTATQIIDDIFAIPINTLGAVNKFLENNVPARTKVVQTVDGEPARVRLGPHARRRANKRVVILDESDPQPGSS